MTKRFALTPYLTCPELEGYKLPPVPEYQDDVEAKLIKLFDSVGHNFELAMPQLKSGLIELCKAREKYEFSMEDIRKFADWILNLTPCQKVSVWSKNGESRGLFDMDGGQLADKFIEKHIRIPRIPIAIEVEMVEVYLLSTDSCAKVPNTHPDGTVKGRWVYE